MANAKSSPSGLRVRASKLRPTPLEAFFFAIGRGVADSRLGQSAPGAIIRVLPPEYREALRELRSDDISNLRVFW